MAKNDRNNSQMEQDAAVFQLFLFHKFTGFGRPVELVFTVSEDMAADKDHHTNIGENDP
ncbi:hypothetical protein D3C74_453580 [compost metagenome]